MNWYIIRVEEGRGFISNRITDKALSYGAVVYGSVFFSYYNRNKNRCIYFVRDIYI